jgi:hypothetical protein
VRAAGDLYLRALELLADGHGSHLVDAKEQEILPARRQFTQRVTSAWMTRRSLWGRVLAERVQIGPGDGFEVRAEPPAPATCWSPSWLAMPPWLRGRGAAKCGISPTQGAFIRLSRCVLTLALVPALLRVR